MQRLIKRANSTSPRMHKEVELSTINGDNNRSKINQANLAFVIAKRLVADLPLVPTNDLIYSIVDDIQVGLYDDLGSLASCDKNWDKWLERTVYILRSQGRLLDYNLNTHKPIMTVK